MPLSRSVSLLLLLILLASCSGDGRTAVTVYSPHGRDLLQVVERAFEAENPDIDVRWLDMGSQEVLERIRSERSNPQADVWYGGPSVLFARAAASDYLAPLGVSWTAGVAADLRSADDLYSALYLTPTLIVFNQDALEPEAAPGDWDALLSAEFRDKVLIRDPLASGTMRTIFGYLLTRGMASGSSLEESVEQGFDWLLALDAQTKEYVHSPALLHEKMVRQEGLVTVWEMTDILGRRAQGAPLGYRFPASGAPVIQDSVALVSGSKQPLAARKFVEWLGSKEALLLAADKAFRLPAAEGVAGLPTWVEEVQAALRPAPMSWSLLEENGADWMARWDREVRARGVAK